MATKPRARVRSVAAPEPAAQTPTQELLSKALETAEVTDPGSGAVIYLKKPGVLAQYRLLEAMGPDRSANQALVQMVQPLQWVTKIGADPVFPPATWDEIEALISRLDEGGLQAVMFWYAVNVIAPINDAIDAAQKAARDKADLKNG